MKREPFPPRQEPEDLKKTDNFKCNHFILGTFKHILKIAKKIQKERFSLCFFYFLSDNLQICTLLLCKTTLAQESTCCFSGWLLKTLNTKVIFPKNPFTIMWSTSQLLTNPNLPSLTLGILFSVVGTFINKFPNSSEPINVGLDFNCKRLLPLSPQFNNNDTNLLLPTRLSLYEAQTVTMIFSFLAPALPIFLNSKTMWNEDKTNALMSQFLGQSAVLGTSEFIRHFSVVVDNTFQQKCNLSIESCKAWTAFVLPLVDQPSKTGLCFVNQTDNSELKNLYDSVHSMPNSIFAMVGSSVVVFLANLFYWTRYNKSNKELSSAHYTIKLLMIIMFLIFITFAVVYRFKEKSQSVTDLALSFFFGIIVQCVMTLLYQVKTMTSPTVNGHTPIVKVLDDIEMKTCNTPLKSS